MIRLIKGLLFALLLVTCNKAEEVNPEMEDKDFAIPDWGEASHGNVQPDYNVVFPQAKVNTLEITMASSDWSGIQTNMQTLLGFAFGAGGANLPGEAFVTGEPDYVGVSVKYNNKEWYKVGFRLKGNSTLNNSWRSGIYKLPFRLHFDKYEDDFPQIKNQRFFGFKELSMSPGAKDNSLIREKAASDIFRMAGIPSSQTAFYKVFINFGDGLKYCGVYTMVEVVDDTMIKNQFGEDKGNIYKPESTFQNFVGSQFEKKNNETENDFSDVQSTINILNSDLRLTNPDQWRISLEQNFYADHFLKWLAANSTMLSWDTYGRMAHNYYLYNSPGKGLTWIPWDNNESLMNRGNITLTISLSGVGNNWPLIRYLMDDSVYQARYKEHVREFIEGVFTPEKMSALFDKYHTLIAPCVIGPDAVEQGKYTYLTNSSLFTSELEGLKQHVINQNLAAIEYLK
ncbi:MAG: CotH kinase family protein [Bacteroidia bacterium]|nr:CotH kinase family protein [Bacteroidia bacterium]